MHPAKTESVVHGIVPDSDDTIDHELLQIWQLFTSLTDVARPLSFPELRTEDLELKGVEGQLWMFWESG